MKVFALVTARGGSKGFPRKNLQLCGGKPLIAWTVLAAAQTPGISKLICSTDCPEIAEIARSYGAEIPFLRPASLASDVATHWAVVEHALEWLFANTSASKDDALLLLQPTSPLRSVSDIATSIAMLSESDAPGVISVSPMEHHPLYARSINCDGRVAPWGDLRDPELPRQCLPPAFYVNGAIFLGRIGSLLEAKSLEPAGCLAYTMPLERAIDVDSELDLRLVEILLERKSS